MGKIPLNDLVAQHEPLEGELRAAISRVIAESRFIGGPDHAAFATEWARFCGLPYAVPCSSGTDALVLAIQAVCGPGDGQREIITVSNTFVATVEMVVGQGYKPVLVDIAPETGLMDLDQVSEVVTPRTAAIIPVHLYGQMVGMDELGAIADRHGVPIIEDAAQAHGASRRGIAPGERSAAATFSFHPSKNLGAMGDAGAVVTRDGKLAEVMERMADHGRSEKHTHDSVGANARMDNLQAAILRVKLPHLSEWNGMRREVARWYDESLVDVPGCRRLRRAEDGRDVYHQYVVRLERRDEVRDALREAGIGCGIHYATPVHEQPGYGFLGGKTGSLPQTEASCREVLSLPMHPYLSRSDVQRVCDAVRSATGRRASKRTVGVRSARSAAMDLAWPSVEPQADGISSEPRP